MPKNNLHSNSEIADSRSRREVLRRTGQLALIAGLPAALAACAVPDNVSRVAKDGSKQILISNGRNCWNNQCFDYDASRGEVSVPGREPNRTPSGINLANGYVSEAEFIILLNHARIAKRIERDERDSDTGSSSSSSGGGGCSGASC